MDGHPRVGHDGRSRSGDGTPRPVLCEADSERDRQRGRSGHTEGITRDPRHVARKAEEHLKQSGIADTCFIGAEPEFFIFDEVRYEQNQHRGYYEIDSVEGAWNTARIEEPNLGYKPSFKGGYFPVSPTDTYHDLRGEMVYEMRKIGIVVEAHHHEVATAGQSEIDMKFEPTRQDGRSVHVVQVHLQERRETTGQDGDVYAEAHLRGQRQRHAHAHVAVEGRHAAVRRRRLRRAEPAGSWAAGGLLKHAAAILAFAAPTTNSYRRLVPGFEAPVNLALSARNRSAAIRIPMYSKSPKAKRLEFRCPDPSCNGYLAWSAMLMAMIDGIQNKADSGEPLDRDIYEMTRDEMKESGIRTTPGSLEEAISALEADHAFLLRGDVFTQDLIQTWIDWKRSKELDPIRLRPHPHEFSLDDDN